MATDLSSGTTGLGSSSVASHVVKASPLGHSRRRSRASKGRRHRHVRRFVVAPRSASPSPFDLSTNLTLRNPRRQQQEQQQQLSARSPNEVDDVTRAVLRQLRDRELNDHELKR